MNKLGKGSNKATLVNSLLLIALSAVVYFGTYPLFTILGLVQGDAPARSVLIAVLTVLTLSTGYFWKEWMLREILPKARYVVLLSLMLFGIAASAPLYGHKDNIQNTLSARSWIVHGNNPFVTPLEEVDDPLLEKTDKQWRKDANIYGPLWMLPSALPIIFFSETSAQLIAMKWLNILAYIGGGLTVYFALRKGRHEKAESVLVLWLLHPLAIFTIGNAGHNEGVLMLALAIFLAGLIRKNPAMALVGITSAILVKYWPIVLLPALLGIKGRRAGVWVYGIGASIVVTILSFLPFIADTNIFLYILRHQELSTTKYFSPGFFLIWNTLYPFFSSRTAQTSVAQGIAVAVLAVSFIVVSRAVYKKRMSSSVAVLLMTAVLFLIVVSWLQAWYLLPLSIFAALALSEKHMFPIAILLSIAGFLSFLMAWIWVLLIVGIGVCLRYREMLLSSSQDGGRGDAEQVE